MTYSFPCQDLSNAGKGAGMEKGSGTRSGLLWEVERLLLECKELGEIPQVLLMENVPEVIGKKNIKHFAKWLATLDRLEYRSKWQILNATDFNIPQNRERLFMVSLLGDYYYEFPNPIGCKVKLKDILEQNVPESYYLKDGTIIKLNECKERCDATPKTFNAGAGDSLQISFIDDENCFGIMTGTSEKFTAQPLKNCARSITTEGKNGVLEWKK